MSGSGEGHRPLPAGRHDDAPPRAALVKSRAETRNTGEKPVTRKGKRGPTAAYASAAEKQRAYRQRKKAT